MILARLIFRLYGSWWRLKLRCLASRGRPLHRLHVFLYEYCQHVYGSSIAWNAEFAGEPCLPHSLKGIFVAGGARIGRNCVIFQQVTIGSSTLADSGSIGAPVLGDNCYVGAGAKIVGRVRLGNNVRVGANAVVYRDVPDNCTVVSGEQRIIPADHPLDNRYFYHPGRWLYFDDGRWRPEADPATLARLQGRREQDPQRPQVRVD